MFHLSHALCTRSAEIITLDFESIEIPSFSDSFGEPRENDEFVVDSDNIPRFIVVHIPHRKGQASDRSCQGMWNHNEIIDMCNTDNMVYIL